MTKVASSLAVLMLAAILAACGGGDATTVTVVEENDAAAESTDQIDKEIEAEEEGESAEEKAELEDECIQKEILAGVAKEGTCVREGTTIVAVNRGTPLKLKTLKAKVLDIRIQKTISNQFGEPMTANGVFVSPEVELTSLASAPVEFSEQQSVMFVAGSTYTQDFEVQNGYEEDSFLWGVGTIQPQSTVTGTITFDMPEKIAKKVDTDGYLDFLNFGAEWYELEEFYKLDEYGTIRLFR